MHFSIEWRDGWHWVYVHEPTSSDGEVKNFIAQTDSFKDAIDKAKLCEYFRNVAESSS